MCVSPGGKKYRSCPANAVCMTMRKKSRAAFVHAAFSPASSGSVHPMEKEELQQQLWVCRSFPEQMYLCFAVPSCVYL